jgi:hypothetical protein
MKKLLALLAGSAQGVTVPALLANGIKAATIIKAAEQKMARITLDKIRGMPDPVPRLHITAAGRAKVARATR